LTADSLQYADKDQQEMRAVAEKTQYAVVKFDIHRVREKKRPQYSRHNFDNFSHCFVIFGLNNPDTSMH